MLPYLERPFSGLDTSIRVEDDIPVWGEGVLDPSVMTSERRFTHALRKSWSWTRTRLPSRRLVIVFVTLHIGTLLAAVAIFFLLASMRIQLRPAIISSGYLTISQHWQRPNQTTALISSPSKDLSGATTPVPVHSHNDYWRTTPLFDALSTGCTSVEADIWFDHLTPNSSELFVSHARRATTPDRTLRSLYIDALLSVLNVRNAELQPTTPRVGVYSTEPSATLVLMLDFKENGTDLWPLVQHHLIPLREAGYLQYWNGTSLNPGPITIVGTGNAPFDLISANETYRDVFFDAPLDKLAGDTRYDHSNSYYASVAMSKSIGRLWGGRFSSAQRSKIQSQIDIARERGLLARYWPTPAWPISLRSRVWRDLVDMGVGMLNADDVVGASRWDWGFCTVLGLPLCGW